MEFNNKNIVASFPIISSTIIVALLIFIIEISKTYVNR